MKDPVEARRKMGYLSNNTKLSDKFTVREYLEMTRQKANKRHRPVMAGAFFYGDDGIRTRDLRVANAALSQLSYVPFF